jgi:hypothetical protein
MLDMLARCKSATASRTSLIHRDKEDGVRGRGLALSQRNKLVLNWSCHYSRKGNREVMLLWYTREGELREALEVTEPKLERTSKRMLLTSSLTLASRSKSTMPPFGKESKDCPRSVPFMVRSETARCHMPLACSFQVHVRQFSTS